MASNKKRIIVALIIIFTIIVGAITTQDLVKKADLRSVIHSEVLSKEEYTPITWRDYSAELNKAKQISWTLFADEYDIRNARYDLEYAIDNLELVPDKTELKNRLDTAAEIDTGLYIPVSVKPFAEAIENANDVFADENAVEEEVASVVAELITAQQDLIETPDKTELQECVDKNSKIEKAKYLPSTYNELENSLNTAKQVVADENSTKDDVDTAIENINIAVASLVVKPDKTELKNLVAAASEYSEENYTTVSYKNFSEKLSTAKNALLNDDANKEQVLTAKTELQEAINGLVRSYQGRFRISVSFDRISNNHVGNSWSRGAWYNDEPISGEEIVASYGGGISIYCQVVENDKIPDVGSGYVYLTLNDDESSATTIYVCENRGRYAGNYAVWEVTCTARLIERI